LIDHGENEEPNRSVGALWRRVSSSDDDKKLLVACLAVDSFFDVAQPGSYFEVKAARLSPLRLSMKALWKKPLFMDGFNKRLFALNSDRIWDVVVGIPFGGIPHAVDLARQGSVPFALWRERVKSGDWLAGEIPQGAQSALVVEDVLATGSSAAGCLRALRAVVPQVRLTAVFTFGLNCSVAEAQRTDVETLFRVDQVVDLLPVTVRAGLLGRYTDFLKQLSLRVDAGEGSSD
jgi:orotate phosphoribosyltransferase